ncbi:hypothetical protein KOW79_008670 [Hemibagrus wyckioides]|uniref:Tumor necrosis factor receptor superfamily member 6 n=2 Tax=Hemibagrus wyckioides TaxID=337641 RepID=A0A9D3NUC9_9TELE|nr:hypothetical protein KOW79_008670 [Hemibagrus wyckioides]
MERKKVLALLCVLWSVVCVMECVPRRRGRETCGIGFYNTSKGIECCQCPQGTYLVKDCTSPRGFPTCYQCEDGTYLDHANSQRKCELCSTCSESENKVKKSPCSLSSNTVCNCKDGHYCETEECKVCHHCSTCDFGVKVSCTPTSDTQCNENPTALVVVSVFVVCLIAGLVVIFFWKKKMFCFKSHEPPENVQVLEPLGDPDLEPFLPQIAEILGFKVVRSVVMHSGLLSKANIDNKVYDHPGDANEQAYQLLWAWYQKHGIEGACKQLCDTLTEMNMRVQAEKVHNLIKTRQSSKEEGQNGHI